MRISKSFLPKLALALGLSPLMVNAAPIYLLLEGKVTASVTSSGLGPTIYDERVGDTVKIQATWDSDQLFGNNASPSPTAGSFGSSDTFQSNPGGQAVDVTYADQTKKSYTTTSLPPPSYSLTRNGGPALNYDLDTYGMISDFGDGLGGWNISLTTEKLAGGSHIVLNINGDTSSAHSAFPGTISNSLSLDLAGPSSILNQNLETFVWDLSLGGNGTGTLGNFDGSGGGQRTISNSDTIQWRRAVLSFNQADVEPIPLPGAGWLLSSAVIGLIVGRKPKKQHQ